MEASTGVIWLMSSEKTVHRRTPSTPRATPTTAVISGIPAATMEPKVTRRTTAATARPISSEVMPISSAPLKALPL